MLTGRNKEQLEEQTKAIIADGGEAAWEPGDPGIHADVTRVVEATVAKFGGVDILDVAHGISIGMVPIQDLTDEQYLSVINANLNGAWYFCKDAAKVMIDQGRGGKIILLGSVRGELGYPKYSAYCPSKGGVHLLGKTLAWELGAYKINVNVIAPGVTRSALTGWLYSEENKGPAQKILDRMPIGRMGEPEDFAGPTVFLASSSSDWIHGHVLCVDGGYCSG